MKREFTAFVACSWGSSMQVKTFVFEIEAEFCPGLCLSGRIKLPFCLDAPLQPPWSIFFLLSIIHPVISHLCFLVILFSHKNLLTLVFLINDSCCRLSSGDSSSGEPPLVSPFPQAECWSQGALVMFTDLHPLGGSRDSDPQLWTYSSRHCSVNAHFVLPECMYK